MCPIKRQKCAARSPQPLVKCLSNLLSWNEQGVSARHPTGSDSADAASHCKGGGVEEPDIDLGRGDVCTTKKVHLSNLQILENLQIPYRMESLRLIPVSVHRHRRGCSQTGRSCTRRKVFCSRRQTPTSQSCLLLDRCALLVCRSENLMLHSAKMHYTYSMLSSPQTALKGSSNTRVTVVGHNGSLQATLNEKCMRPGA